MLQVEDIVYVKEWDKLADEFGEDSIGIRINKHRHLTKRHKTLCGTAVRVVEILPERRRYKVCNENGRCEDLPNEVLKEIDQHKFALGDLMLFLEEF